MCYKNLTYIFFLSLFLLLSALTLSCEKEEMLDDPSARLVFSSDTILFDTIFTKIGSVTRHFKVYNPYDKSLEISGIKLSGGENSPYRINVDGISGLEFNNVLLKQGDSIYIFVETTIDPNDSNSPIIAEDSIVFETNGNIQDVKLLAWGQDVNVIRRGIFKTTLLTAEKPYLVYDYLLVDTGHVLTLSPGVRLHFNNDSRLLVAGTIIAEGDQDNPILFEGARIEGDYRNVPGQWEGIYLMPLSNGNRFVHTRIKNAVSGITVDSLTGEDTPKLHLANSRIENMTYSGVFGTGASIYSINTLINNCGFYAVLLTGGGDYSFYHVTIANYWRFSSRSTPSVQIQNYHTNNSGSVQTYYLSAVFGNSIIHGSKRTEVDFSVKPGAGVNIYFDHSLLNRENTSQSEANFHNCIFNVSPGFVDPGEYNFDLSEDSPAINSGDPDISILFPFDYRGKFRPYGDGPDMGAFERHEE